VIAAFQSLWKELLGSWWVLVVIPLLVLLRWLLTSRWMTRSRSSFFSLRGWNAILSPPAAGNKPGENGAAAVATGSTNGASPPAGAAAQADVMEPAEFRRRWFLELVESALVALFLVFFIIRPFIVQAFYIPSPSMVETLEVYDRILVNKFIYRIEKPNRGDIVVFEPPARATERVGDDWIKRVIALGGDSIAVHHNHLYLNGVIQNEPYAALLDQSSDKPGMQHVSTGTYDYQFPDPNQISLSPGENAYVYPAPEDSLETAINERLYTVRRTSDKAPAADGGNYLFFVHDDPKVGLEAVVPPGKVFVMGDNRNDSEDSHFWGYLDENRILGRAFCIFWPVNRVRWLGNPHAH